MNSILYEKKPRIFLKGLYFNNEGRQFRIFSSVYEGWNFNSGNYLFTTDIK